MTTIKKFTDEEANSIEEITRVYKINLVILQEESNILDDNYMFEDCETGEIFNIKEGMSQIIDVINCDDRELFNTIDTEKTKTFTQLCKKLELE